MRKILCLILALMTAFAVVACGSDGDDTESSVMPESSESVTEISKEESIPMEVTKTITNLNYKNYGRMGDLDGPAFAVYSKQGYTGATVKVDIANSEVNGKMTDGKAVNGYAFLGIDIYGDDGEWDNCIDAGLCWAGADEGWHIFYNMFKPLNPSTQTWYESRVKLPYNDTYVMTFTTIDDNYALLTVRGEKFGASDSVKVEVKGAKKDGSNTAFLFNAAMDFPPDTMVDRNGNYCDDNWVEVVLANTDKNAYLRKLRVFDMKLLQADGKVDWTEDKNDAVSIWPTLSYPGMDYVCTKVDIYDGTEYYIDFDMNR